MITRRGWWPVLEPVLLAFTVVVCGGVSLVAQSHASVLDRNDQSDTSGSNFWTAAFHDSVDDSDDDGDDDDNVGDALFAPSIISTSDASHAVPRVEADVPFSLRSARLSSRGPPDCDHQCDAPRSNRESVTAASHVSVDDGDDDDDDDDDAGDALLAAPTILTSDESHHGPSVQTHARCSLRSERLSSRGPPRGSPDRDLSSWTAGESERHRQNSSDDDIDDDDDDDDDDSSELGGSSPTSNLAQSRILIVSELDGPFSFASDLHSLRAPPQ